jgi:hypothetical protein
LEYKASWAFVKSFIRKAGSLSYSQQEEDERRRQDDNQDEETKMNKDEKEEEAINDEEKKEEVKGDYDDDSDTANFLDFDDVIDLACLLDNDEEYITKVDQHLEDLLYSDETVSAVLSELGATLSNDQSEVRKSTKHSRKLSPWLNQHPLLRPVYFQSAAKLKLFAKSLNPVCVLDPKVSQSAMLSALALHLTENPLTSIDAAVAPQQTASTSHLSKKQKLMRSFISSGFLAKLATKQRADTRHGLDLEEPKREKPRLKSLRLHRHHFATEWICRFRALIAQPILWLSFRVIRTMNNRVSLLLLNARDESNQQQQLHKRDNWMMPSFSSVAVHERSTSLLMQCRMHSRTSSVNVMKPCRFFITPTAITSTLF